MRHKIKALIAVGMAAAVLTACSDGGTETKDSGPTVSETGVALPFRGRTAQPAPKTA